MLFLSLLFILANLYIHELYFEGYYTAYQQI